MRNIFILINFAKETNLTEIIMKLLSNISIAVGMAAVIAGSVFAESVEPDRDYVYVPSEEVIRSQKDFAADRFGIFIHWGIYSMFGQGEWYLNYGPDAKEYAKAARGFYPADFDASEWVDAIKDSGARYITFVAPPRRILYVRHSSK